MVAREKLLSKNNDLGGRAPGLLTPCYSSDILKALDAMLFIMPP